MECDNQNKEETILTQQEIRELVAFNERILNQMSEQDAYIMTLISKVEAYDKAMKVKDQMLADNNTRLKHQDQLLKYADRALDFADVAVKLAVEIGDMK